MAMSLNLEEHLASVSSRFWPVHICGLLHTRPRLHSLLWPAFRRFKHLNKQPTAEGTGKPQDRLLTW